MNGVESVPVVLLRAAELVLDSTLYVRWAVDKQHVRRLADALETGAVLPPIGVQAAGRRVIYGVHRVLAYRLVGGDAVEVRARLFDVDDAGAIRLALAENSEHGLPYRPMDMKHALIVAERFALSDDEIMRCLHVPPGRLMDLRARRAFYRHGAAPSSANGQVTETVPLKGSMVHLRGRELTAEQYAILPLAPGSGPALMAKQLAGLIEAGAINRRSESLRLALLVLRSALDSLNLEEVWSDAGDEARDPAVS